MQGIRQQRHRFKAHHQEVNPYMTAKASNTEPCPHSADTSQPCNLRKVVFNLALQRMAAN
jgi:hypothetical protein